MKYLRTVFCIFLVILLSASIMSCNSSDNDELFDTEFSFEQNSTKFAGKHFWYGLGISNDNTENIMGFEPSMNLADLAMERIRQIEKDNDCVIDIDYDNWESLLSRLNTSVISNDKGFSAMFNESFKLRPLAESGFLNGFLECDFIDVTDEAKWGTPSLLESMCWKDDVYGLTVMAWPELPYRMFNGSIVINEEIVAKMGYTDPRDYVENGVWDWDNFEKSLIEFTFSESDRTVFGIQVHLPYYYEEFARSNGNRLIEKNSSGEYVFGWGTDTAVAALTKGQQIRNTCSDCFHKDTSTSDDWFLNGDCVMSIKHASVILNKLAYEMNSFGIVPFVHGPAAEDNFKSFHESNSAIVCVPVNADDPDFSMYILNRIYEPLEGYASQEDIYNYMLRNTFLDVRDCECFFKMLENSNYSYFREGARGILEKMDDNVSVTQLIERYKDSMASIMEKEVIPTYTVIEQLWK